MVPQARLRALTQKKIPAADPHPNAWLQPKALLSKRVTSIGADKRPNVWTPSREPKRSHTSAPIFASRRRTRRSNAGRQASEFHNRALVCAQTDAAAHRFTHTLYARSSKQP